MLKLVEQGISIIMISSELPEVINMSDRVYVMSEGRITGEFTSSQEDITQEKLLYRAAGGKEE